MRLPDAAPAWVLSGEWLRVQCWCLECEVGGAGDRATWRCWVCGGPTYEGGWRQINRARTRNICWQAARRVAQTGE